MMEKLTRLSRIGKLNPKILVGVPQGIGIVHKQPVVARGVYYRVHVVLVSHLGVRIVFIDLDDILSYCQCALGPSGGRGWNLWSDHMAYHRQVDAKRYERHLEPHRWISLGEFESRWI
jgi:hypothetical protein